ncbi:sigma-70 family RNA polymerase sigma factor [Sphingobacterium sp. N143]|uniref:RNA polymerase sigma factor n=1 Tax=Sphingobacterium sp. N143 TaxID=2746727 RepID=UPI0025750CB6|nr:sigma-70 family RNA polymerase sigma factor [Sphingobacterium sp. N143]MDM1294216.1 sigma-70 family RNA polymerase sigma factor [Sphingobacterium sp. N143]
MINRTKSLDCENLNKLKEGNELALTFFYNKYAKKVFAMAFYIIKDRFLAEDIVQEVFVHFWNSRERLGEEKELWLILYVMCKQKSLNKLRSVLRYQKHRDLHIERLKVSESFVDNHFGVKDIKRLLEQAMTKMTPMQRKVFQLSREEDMTHLEIAQHLAISPNTVKNHMVAALAILKMHFRGHEFMTISIFLISVNFF